jgi:mannose-6-phosphate isomerase-like protein (cupin superfamily)
MNHAAVFDRVAKQLKIKKYHIVATDFQRPWGGFFVIDESQSMQFVKEFFPEVDAEDVVSAGKVSPKILVVAPQKRLSWQYHYRRKERWQVLEGPVAVATSSNNEQPEPDIYMPGDIIVLAQGERHRLIGLENWGVVAEIWQHTDPIQPSDEADIVRVQDDFKRT